MVPSSRTVLIVDDSSEDRELYRRYLLRDRECSYTILEAALGQQGLELWQHHQPDVVLLDYRLPDLDGLEFLAQLQLLIQQPCLPVIVVTGQGNEVIAVQAMKAGAQDYLIKEQITPEGLQLAMNGVIETVQLRTQLQQRIEGERLIAQITQKIHQTLDLEEILQTTVTGVRQFLQTDRVIVFRLFPDGNGTVIAESVKVEWQTLLSSTIYDPCLVEGNCRRERPEVVTPEIVAYDPDFNENYVERYRQGRVTAKANIYDGSIDPCHVELLERFQVRANLVVPILHEDQFWGLLIAHHCAAPRQWQALEIDLLQQLGTQVSIALRQAELYQQSQQELAERQYAEEALRQANEELQMTIEELRIAQEELLTQNENLEETYKMVSLERQRYEDLFNFAPDSYVTTDLLGVIQEANWAAAELLAVDRQDLIGQIFFTYVPSQAIPALSNHLDESRRSRQKRAWKSILVSHGEGQPFPVEITVIPIQDEQDRVAGIRWLVRDITQRQRIETALRESEERFRQLAENINLAFWIREVADNRVSYVSPAYEQLWGLDPQELYETQQSWSRRIHPDDQLWVDRAFQEKASTGQFDEQYRIVLADGSVRWVHDRCFPLYNQAGELYRFTGIAEDITDRKQAEETLRQSEEFKRRMLESSSDCIKLLNLDGQLLYINTGGLCLLEIDDLTPYINAEWASFWPENDRRTAEEAVATARMGEPSRFQGLCPTAKGTPKWWDVVVTPIQDTLGQVIQLLVISRDITERKQSEEALRDSEERFRTLADNMSQFAWMADAGGDIFWYNQRWFDYTGTTLEEMRGWGWQKVHHPDHVERVVQHIRHCFETGQLWEDTFPLQGQDGQYRWFLSRAIPIRDQNNKIICWFGTNTDIDDRKQVEEALRQSEERYRCLAELIPQLVWTASPVGALLDVNQRWSNFTGVSLEQVQAGGWEQVVHPEDLPVLIQQWTEAVRQEIPYQAEGRMRRADGVYRWHLHQAIPQKDEQGQIVKWFGTATDIETQKQLEGERDRLLQQEQIARAEAERANRIKDDFLAILSHELRSPLNPILGWAKLLQTRTFEPAKTAEALATIERNAKLQTQLIDDLLDVAKILRGKLSLTVAPIDLTFVIEAAIDTVRTAALAKKIQLHPVLPPIGQVSGDATRLQQIVWNLLSNAIKFTPRNGRVDIRLECVDQQAQLTVGDTGKGISPDFLPYIFESFRQEDASTTRRYGGLGLGLAIVRHLVEAHGGTIWADSPGEDQGATFTVRLPLLDVDLEQSQIGDLPEQELDLTGIRALVVDDEPDARELLTAVLTQYGAEVLTVTSATEVLANLESFQPNVLVSDLGMPDVDGYALIQQIRTLPAEQGGQVPAIALTAYAREEDYQRTISSGFQRHIAKPLEPAQLVQAIMVLAPHR